MAQIIPIPIRLVPEHVRLVREIELAAKWAGDALLDAHDNGDARAKRQAAKQLREIQTALPGLIAEVEAS